MNDITVIGNVLAGDGIGNHLSLMSRLLRNNFKINYKIIGKPNYKDIDPELLAEIIKPFSGYGKIGLYVYILGLNENLISLHEEIRRNCKISIAYSMFESTQIPDFWVTILNKYYDIVIVPDLWVAQTYKNCGVNIRIEVIPLPLNLEKFLESPIHKKNEIFTFGMTGSAFERKHHLQVLDAFEKKFGNKTNFKLKLHARHGYKDKIEEKLFTSKLNNVEVIFQQYSSDDYLKWMQSLDCYVFVSGGEGFSITPRESLALGIPTIISDCTAHKTICDSGFVIPIACPNKYPAIYEVFQNKQFGYFYKCDTDEISEKMEWVYENYDISSSLSQKGRDWNKQYLKSHLIEKYVKFFNELLFK